MKILTLVLIRFYQYGLSPHLKTLAGGGCRFSPTCSEYSCRAIKRHGFLKGLLLSSKRILKCNPLSTPGFDPVR